VPALQSKSLFLSVCNESMHLKSQGNPVEIQVPDTRMPGSELPGLFVAILSLYQFD